MGSLENPTLCSLTSLPIGEWCRCIVHRILSIAVYYPAFLFMHLRSCIVTKLIRSLSDQDLALLVTYVSLHLVSPPDRLTA